MSTPGFSNGVVRSHLLHYSIYTRGVSRDSSFRHKCLHEPSPQTVRKLRKSDNHTNGENVITFIKLSQKQRRKKILRFY